MQTSGSVSSWLVCGEGLRGVRFAGHQEGWNSRATRDDSGRPGMSASETAGGDAASETASTTRGEQSLEGCKPQERIWHEIRPGSFGAGDTGEQPLVLNAWTEASADV